MLVFPVLDPNDYSRITGYFINGQIVDELPNSRRGFLKSERVDIAADQAYILGRGIINLVAERQISLHVAEIRAEVQAMLDNDTFTKSLKGIIEP